MAVICLNCEGWDCAQCKLEREAAAGGEQGPTAEDLELVALRHERDTFKGLADDLTKFLGGRVAELEIELTLERQKARAQMSAILYTIGGEVEGAPTLSINYLQRLRQLTRAEAERDAARAQLQQCDDERIHQAGLAATARDEVATLRPHAANVDLTAVVKGMTP